MKMNIITSGVPALERNLSWYLSRIDKRIRKSVTFDTSRTLYMSENLSSVIVSTKLDNYLISNGYAFLLVSDDDNLVAEFKSGVNPQVRIIEVKATTIDLSHEHLLDIVRSTESDESNKLKKNDIDPSASIYGLISQATGVSKSEIKDVIVSLFGVASILLLEKMNEDCDDPIIEVDQLGHITVEDGKPLVLVGKHGIDSQTNLQLTADQMLYNLINRTSRERLDLLKEVN